MPTPGRFFLRGVEIEVAPRLGLKADVSRALRRHGPLTGPELADYLYWGRTPKSRLGAKWVANLSMRSSTRRAIAALKRLGLIDAGGRPGRPRLYQLSHAGLLSIQRRARSHPF